MTTRKAQRAVGLAGLALTAALTVGACSSSHSEQPRAAASSVLADPRVATLENELLTSYKKNFNPAHPYESMKVTLHQVFPKGDLSKLITFGVQQLTPTMAASKKARHAWANKVVLFELSQTAQGVGTSTAQPPIPGVTNPATPKAPVSPARSS